MPLKKNIIANYIGQGWVALMQLAFIPLYIKYLGMEAYGLIGVYAVLQAVFLLMDMGMAPTLNREMASFTAGKHTSQSIRELLFSIEVISIGIALLIIMVMLVTSSWLAMHWLQADQLPIDTVKKTIAIMGIVAALRVIESIYRGAIIGLQTQVWLNKASAFLATARWFGVVGVLSWISPSILAFFWWQAFISFVTVIIFALRVHQVLPTASRAVRFSKPAILGISDFAKGMIATTALSLILTQTDKILLSRLLSLEAFGAYTLAATVANGLMLLVSPLTQSYYPRFTELLVRHNDHGLIAAYHQASQLMVVMVVPVTLILIFHGEAVLYLWTGNNKLAHNSSQLVALLALGTAFLGLMNIPYMLQLAHGWSIFAAKVNAIIIVVMIPVLLWATPRYGAIGAACVWVAITSSYIFIVIPIMHRRLIPKEKWRWYWQDNILPTCAASCVVLAGLWVHPILSSNIGQLAWLTTVGLFSFGSALFAAPILRNKLLKLIWYKFQVNQV